MPVLQVCRKLAILFLFRPKPAWGSTSGHCRSASAEVDVAACRRTAKQLLISSGASVWAVSSGYRSGSNRTMEFPFDINQIFTERISFLDQNLVADRWTARRWVWGCRLSLLACFDHVAPPLPNKSSIIISKYQIIFKFKSITTLKRHTPL